MNKYPLQRFLDDLKDLRDVTKAYHETVYGTAQTRAQELEDLLFAEGKKLSAEHQKMIEKLEKLIKGENDE